MGFCMGGMQVFKAAASGVFERGVAFYGMVKVPEMWGGGGIREPLATATNVCPTLAIFGGVDHFVPPEDVDALRDAGWSDEDVMDIAEVTGLFNMSNRMASGLGWTPNPEYEELGR